MRKLLASRLKELCLLLDYSVLFSIKCIRMYFRIQFFFHRQFLHLKIFLSAAENVPREVPDYSQFMAPKGVDATSKEK